MSSMAFLEACYISSNGTCKEGLLSPKAAYAYSSYAEPESGYCEFRNDLIALLVMPGLSFP